MASRLAIIASSVSGIPEVVENEKTALLVPPDDVDALYGSIKKLINDEYLRVKLADASYNEITVKKKFTWGKSAISRLEIAEKIIYKRN